MFPDEGKLSQEKPAGGKWSVQAQDSVVHETTADVSVNASSYTHIRFYVYKRMYTRTQEKGRQSDSNERIPACQEIYPAFTS